MAKVIKNCETCWVKKENINEWCPIMEVEFHGNEVCFGWVKDMKEWDKRQKGCDAYYKQYDAARVKKVYRCQGCGEDYLQYYKKRATCPKCGFENRFADRKGMVK